MSTARDLWRRAPWKPVVVSAEMSAHATVQATERSSPSANTRPSDADVHRAGDTRGGCCGGDEVGREHTRSVAMLRDRGKRRTA
jgi:hypothetical protein